MKYYWVKKPAEPEILGITDGLNQAWVAEKKFRNKKNYAKFEHYFANILKKFDINEALQVDLNLEYVELRKKAKLTDFLWFSPRIYLLISERVKQLLEEHEIAPHRLFPTTLIDSDGDQIETDYFFLLCQWIDFDNVNFKKCEFTVMDFRTKVGYRPIKVNSLADLDKYEFDYKIRKIALQKIDTRFDLFEIRLSSDLIISERLYKKLIALNITGVIFKEVEVEFGD